MPQLTFYIDTANNQLLTAINSSRTVDASRLPLFYPDTLQLQIYLMLPIQMLQASIAQYDIISSLGLAIALEITNGLAAEDEVIYASQYVWATDANDQYFFANLSLNTVGIKTLVKTSEPNAAQAYLNIGYTSIATGQRTVLRKPINIGIGVGNVQLVVPPQLTALAKEVADQLYVGFVLQPGQSITFVTPNGKKILFQAVDNPDGTAQMNESNMN